MTAHETASSPERLMLMFAERAADGDAAGLLALYEPDAVFEPQLGLVLRGHAQIDEAPTSLRPRAGRRPLHGDRTA